MKKAPPVNFTPADAAAFHDATKAAGVHRAQCGLAAVTMARRLRAAPVVPVQKMIHGRRVAVIPGNETGSMGALIRQRFARWHAEAGFYELTPDGEAWLTAVDPFVKL